MPTLCWVSSWTYEAGFSTSRPPIVTLVGVGAVYGSTFCTVRKSSAFASAPGVIHVSCPSPKTPVRRTRFFDGTYHQSNLGATPASGGTSIVTVMR